MEDTNNAAAAAASAFPPPPPYFQVYSDLATAPHPPPPLQQDFTLFGAPYQVCSCFEPLEDPSYVSASGLNDAWMEVLVSLQKPGD